ncbi:hypothetical protein H5410_062038 [Solanum commersonii]|uniref:DUF4216 domain-containing protein n=1 Tax=Solanum commersonii TaxID=4109 RepID=A0A9J5WB14_SOLCO|nr:hypothetical protein H5410_062038 [Solanum commersonii]
MHYETGGGLKHEFIDGVRDFIEHTMTVDIFKNNGLVRCHCSACGMESEQYFDEAPNEEAIRLYDQLEKSSRPLCEGSLHSALRNRPNHYNEGDIDPLFPPISIFNQIGRGLKNRGKRSFTSMEMQSGVTHILLNCPKIQPYLKQSYDPFIIAHNAKLVYYAPYPLRRDKADWWVVIKTKLVGRIEIDNVLDVAYQNEVEIVQ